MRHIKKSRGAFIILSKLGIIFMSNFNGCQECDFGRMTISLNYQMTHKILLNLLVMVVHWKLLCCFQTCITCVDLEVLHKVTNEVFSKYNPSLKKNTLFLCCTSLSAPYFNLNSYKQCFKCNIYLQEKLVKN